jgi:hypothetical protein
MVRSLDPDAKNLFIGSTARHLTQPACPLITVLSFQGACHFGSLNLRYLNATALWCTASAYTRLESSATFFRVVFRVVFKLFKFLF